jgi:hypothetical protein
MSQSLYLEPGKQIVLLLAGGFDKNEVLELIEPLCGYPYRWGLWILSDQVPKLPASINPTEIAGVLIPTRGGNLRRVLCGDQSAICAHVIQLGIPLGAVFMNPWRVIDLKPWFFNESGCSAGPIPPYRLIPQGLTMPFRTA